MYITAQDPRLRNDLYCVEWDVKLYYTIPYHVSVARLTYVPPNGCNSWFFKNLGILGLKKLKSSKVEF